MQRDIGRYEKETGVLTFEVGQHARASKTNEMRGVPRSVSVRMSFTDELAGRERTLIYMVLLAWYSSELWFATVSPDALQSIQTMYA